MAGGLWGITGGEYMRSTSSSSRLADRVGCRCDVVWFVLFVWMCSSSGGSEGMLRYEAATQGFSGSLSGTEGDGRHIQESIRVHRGVLDPGTSTRGPIPASSSE